MDLASFSKTPNFSSSHQWSADEHAPARARSFVAAAIAEWELPYEVPVFDVVLATSELVTNSVRAGSSQVTVDVHASPVGLELSVGDDAPGMPAVQTPDRDSTSGRGLRIVAEIADTWGVATDEGPHVKRVTALWDADPTLGRTGSD